MPDADDSVIQHLEGSRRRRRRESPSGTAARGAAAPPALSGTTAAGETTATESEAPPTGGAPTQAAGEPVIDLVVRVRRSLDDLVVWLLAELRRLGVRTTKVELTEMALWELWESKPEELEQRLAVFRRRAPALVWAAADAEASDKRPVGGVAPSRPLREAAEVGADAPSEGQQLDSAVVDAIATRLVDPLAKRVVDVMRDEGLLPEPSPPNVWLDASEVAQRLGVTRAWVYEHATELGAIRIGEGPRARLRFPPGAPKPERKARHQPVTQRSSNGRARGLIPIYDG
jgi:hypothetical protein